MLPGSLRWSRASGPENPHTALCAQRFKCARTSDRIPRGDLLGGSIVTLNARVSAALPPLAWLLEIDGSPERHRLLCGTSVILSQHAFFEGAWPGTVSAMDFGAK